MVNPIKKLFQSKDNPVQSKIIIHAKPLSTTGTAIYSGYTAEEYLSTLRNSKQRADIYDEMRRSDPQIKMAIKAVTYPLMSANYEICPHDPDDEESKKDAELCEFVLKKAMAKTWTEFLMEAYSLIAFGHSVFEIIDGVEINHPEFGTVNTIKNLQFISPRTIERWNVDKETCGLKSITQVAYGDLNKYVDIPSEFLLTFTLEKEGSLYEGVSALRCVYGNYFRKNLYLKLNGIGIEKFAIPSPIVKVPTGKEGSTQFDNLTEALEAYAAHEKAYLTIPEGWEVDLKTNTYDPQKVEISIDNEDKRMIKAFMANFLELGMNGFGSQSLSFDLSDFFLGSINYIAKIFCEEMSRKILPAIVKKNRGERPGYPYMKASGISDKVGVELSQTLQNLYNAKILTPDDELEAHVRKRYDLPEASELGREDRKPEPIEPIDPEDPKKKVANPKMKAAMQRIYGKNNG